MHTKDGEQVMPLIKGADGRTRAVAPQRAPQRLTIENHSTAKVTLLHEEDANRALIVHVLIEPSEWPEVDDVRMRRYIDAVKQVLERDYGLNRAAGVMRGA